MDRERVRNKIICNTNSLIDKLRKKIKLNGQLTQLDRSNLLK